jgi:hypothetical protein
MSGETISFDLEAEKREALDAMALVLHRDRSRRIRNGV